MPGVAIEQMLELWCVELRQVKADLKHLEVALNAHTTLPDVLATRQADLITGNVENVCDWNSNLTARIKSSIEYLYPEVETFYRGPEGVGANAVFVEVKNTH